MYTPEQVAQKITKHTDRFQAEDAWAEQSVTWEVIHRMENAWRTEPVKVRTANRRSVLRYLFGLDSTKTLTHAQILALRQWVLHSKDCEAELHAVLTAALVAAGQTELEI